MLVAILAALGSALFFAISSSLQHQAAASVPADEAHRTVGFIASLLKKPLWVLGQLLAATAFGLHAWALHIGALAVVQPIVVSGMVFAVPLRAAMSHRVPSGAELRAVALTAVGLAVFLIASNPDVTEDDPRVGIAVTIVIVGAAVGALATAIASRSKIATHRAFFMGVTAGIMFGLVAGMVKLSIGEFNDDGWTGLLSSWSLWTLLVLGACGVTTNLRAYRVADLSASLPALSIVNVLVALVVGLAVFDEIPQHSAGALALELAAFAAIAVGLRQLTLVAGVSEAAPQSDPESESVTAP